MLYEIWTVSREGACCYAAAVVGGAAMLLLLVVGAAVVEEEGGEGRGAATVKLPLAPPLVAAGVGEREGLQGGGGGALY